MCIPLCMLDVIVGGGGSTKFSKSVLSPTVIFVFLMISLVI